MLLRKFYSSNSVQPFGKDFYAYSVNVRVLTKRFDFKNFDIELKTFGFHATISNYAEYRLLQYGHVLRREYLPMRFD